MTDDTTRGWFTRPSRDTTQLDLEHGGLVPQPREVQQVSGPAPTVTHDTVQVDRSVFASDRVPSPAVATGDRSPDPLADTGSVAVSGVRLRTVEHHLDEILGAVPTPEPIELAVLDAQGLLCAELVTSERSLPSFDQAGLDGYAVRSADVAVATVETPVELHVVGESAAGSGEATSIAPGLAQKVAVGAMMPAGADIVVPAAWTDQGLARVAVYAALAPGSYVRRIGDDVATGDTAVQVGTPIGPAQISLLAAVGRERVAVRPRPRIAVLCAGDELVRRRAHRRSRPAGRRQQLRPGRRGP